jgi:uncharacterized protein (DUF2461 family)
MAILPKVRWGFLTELRAHNSRDWFQANKGPV